MQEKYTQNPTVHTNIPLTTPVLFLIFNRPETTEQVFSAIKKALPLRLYIAADGPRSEYPDEANNCKIFFYRKILKAIIIYVAGDSTRTMFIC